MTGQIDLLRIGFEVEETMQESTRSLSRKAVTEAADIVVEILRETQLVMLGFTEIVKRKMGLADDSIPFALARQFADSLDAVSASRLSIKELVESSTDYRLTVTDAIGRPAIRGGAPSGFTTLHSPIGMESERAQAEMTVAKMQALLNRKRLLGGISEEDLAVCLAGVKNAGVLLLQAQGDTA